LVQNLINISKGINVKLYGRSVLVQDGNYEKALRKFKKKINDSGLLNDLRDREFYEKPTTERKRKKSAAKNRWQKELIKQALPKKQF
jgi:small subunit ribosomal protein S21